MARAHPKYFQGKSIATISKELGRDSQRKRFQPRVHSFIGRSVIGGVFMDRLQETTSLNNELMTLTPLTNPHLGYIRSDRLTIIYNNGITSSDPRLNLSPDVPLPSRINQPEDLYQAILASRSIDKEASLKNATVPILNVAINHVENKNVSGVFNIDLVIGDERNDFYSETGGFTLRGEKFVLGPIQTNNYQQARIFPDGPHHRLHIAEVRLAQRHQTELRFRLGEYLTRMATETQLALGPLTLASES